MKRSNQIVDLNVSNQVIFDDEDIEIMNPDIETKRDNKFLLSQTLVRDMIYNRLFIPYKKDRKSLMRYELFYHKVYQMIFNIMICINLFMIFFEEPQSFNFFKMPKFLPEAINFICLAYFMGIWFHIFSFVNHRLFFKETYSIATPIVFILIIIDLSINVLLKLIDPNLYYVQWSRVLRPFFMVLFPQNFSMRSAIGNIRHTLVDIFPTVCLFLFMLTFFSIICFELFVNAGIKNFDGTPYFHKFPDCIYELYILVTTANSPDVILPALEKHTLSFIIFIVVTTVCNWIFMGVIMANIYNTYKEHLKLDVIENTKRKKKKLAKAFNLLKSENDKITHFDFVKLMKSVFPKMTNAHCDLLFYLIDNDDTRLLKLGEFIRLSEYVDLPFEEIHIEYDNVKKRLPVMYYCYSSTLNSIMLRIFRHGLWKVFSECFVMISIILMIATVNTKYELTIEIIFTCFFVAEVLIRVVPKGKYLILKYWWNVIEIIFALLAPLSLLVNTILALFEKNVPNYIIRIILILRVLQILKLLQILKRFYKLINGLRLILPSLFSYALVQLSFYYVYVCLGMELFGGKYQQPKNNKYTNTTDCGNPKLLNSDFVSLHYCILNFNNAWNGFIFMFILTVSNNWHILLKGSTLTTSEAAKIFYISIHWICVFLVMNIVIAFIIDAFMVEMELKNTKFQDFIESRLNELNVSAKVELEKRGLKNFGKENFDLTHEMLEKAFEENRYEDKVCFRFTERNPRSMEVLLKRMFEADVEQLQHEFVMFLNDAETLELFNSSITNSHSKKRKTPQLPNILNI